MEMKTTPETLDGVKAVLIETLGIEAKKLRDRRIVLSGLAGILCLLAALAALKLQALRRLS